MTACGKQSRLYAVEFLRVWFILNIIILHTMNRYPEVKDGIMGLLHYPKTEMALAVECFFVIGGFFLYKRVMTEGAWTLIRKVYLRLMSVLLFGYVLSLACNTVMLQKLPRMLAMTIGTSLSTSVVSPGDWFIGVYFWTTCLFIGIFKCLPKSRWLVFGLLVFFALDIKVHALVTPAERTSGYFGTYFSAIGVGMVKGIACMGIGIVAGYVSGLFAKYRPRRLARLMFTAAEALALMCVYNAMLNKGHSHLEYMDLLLYMGLLLISIEHSWGYISALLNRISVVQYASRYCFPALIGHIVCIRCLVKYHSFGWNGIACSIFIVAGGIALGMIEYHLVEKLLIPKLKRYICRNNADECVSTASNNE